MSSKDSNNAVDDKEGKNTSEMGKICLSGGCHCGKVRFKAQYAMDTFDDDNFKAKKNAKFKNKKKNTKPNSHCIDVYKCNCSICIMKQNVHFVVPQSDFELQKGHDSLTD